MEERPLITKEWRDANLETYGKIQQTPDECPICYRGRRDRPDIEPLPRFVCFNSPLSNGLGNRGGEPVRCTHWACTECWDKIKIGNRRCPICRDDLTCWFEHTRITSGLSMEQFYGILATRNWKWIFWNLSSENSSSRVIAIERTWVGKPCSTEIESVSLKGFIQILADKVRF